MGICYGLAALGVAVLLRAGQISFGHAMYACISGYAVAFLARAFPQLDGLVLIAAGVAVSVVAGAVVGLFVVRYRGIFFGMLNLAISMVLYSLLSKLYELTGGSDGLRITRPTLAGLTFERGGFETAMLILTIVAALVLGWLVQRYFNSSAGADVLAHDRCSWPSLRYARIKRGAGSDHGARPAISIWEAIRAPRLMCVSTVRSAHSVPPRHGGSGREHFNS